jgi:formylglycine-generating enzyme required for sulfatase activity
MKFVRITAGTFKMGSPNGEKHRADDETHHEVTLTKDYYLGLYTVTRGQFRTFVDNAKYKTEAERDGVGAIGWDVATNASRQDPKYTWQNPGFDQSDSRDPSISWPTIGRSADFCRVRVTGWSMAYWKVSPSAAGDRQAHRRLEIGLRLMAGKDSIDTETQPTPVAPARSAIVNHLIAIADPP